MNENEQGVFDILSKAQKMDLGELKTQSGLSNKQWDKSIKGLRNHGLVNVTKEDDNLIISLVAE